MIYLNDIKEGGGTHFCHQNFTTKPVAGNLYIWPAGWTHMHAGVNAPYESKYTITGWVEYLNKYGYECTPPVDRNESTQLATSLQEGEETKT